MKNERENDMFWTVSEKLDAEDSLGDHDFKVLNGTSLVCRICIYDTHPKDRMVWEAKDERISEVRFQDAILNEEDLLYLDKVCSIKRADPESRIPVKGVVKIRAVGWESFLIAFGKVLPDDWEAEYEDEMGTKMGGTIKVYAPGHDAPWEHHVPSRIRKKKSKHGIFEFSYCWWNTELKWNEEKKEGTWAFRKLS